MKKKVAFVCFYDRINLSIRTLSSVLKREGHEVYLIFFKDDRTAVIDDFRDTSNIYQYIYNGNYIGCGADINPATESEFKLLENKLTEINPDVIGFSARTPFFEISKQIVQRLRKLLSETLYIAGGYGPSLEPEKFLECFDYICLGEGEDFILKLVNSEKIEKIPNLARKVDGEVVFNKMAPPVDLNNTIYPDWGQDNKYAIEDDQTHRLVDTYDRQTYDIFTSRGCPSSCTYCMASHWGIIYKRYDGKCPKIRHRSPQSVIDELMLAKERYDINYVRFMDSIFGYHEKWLNEFLDLYDEKVGIDFFCHLDCRFTNENTLKRLKRSGLQQTTIGIQSLDPEIRKEIMGRTITNEKILKYAWTVHDLGFKFQYDIIHWNPFDTEESLEGAVQFIKQLPKGVQIVLFHLVFFPGSRLHELYLEKNPKHLPSQVYEFWAWIYILILRGGEFEKIADFFLSHRSARNYPQLLKELYHEVLNTVAGSQKITARREIKKGESIKMVMLDYVEDEKHDGITYEDRVKLVNLVPIKDIAKGEMVQWKDLYSSYSYK
jgi:radical SAM superfamily enzyme YgiQ (UPF0313 family)